jgi:hypothetical protein
MKTFKQILESTKRTERLQKAISPNKLINRLGNISGQLNKGTISYTEADKLYGKEATRVKNIRNKLK